MEIRVKGPQRTNSRITIWSSCPIPEWNPSQLTRKMLIQLHGSQEPRYRLGLGVLCREQAKSPSLKFWMNVDLAWAGHVEDQDLWPMGNWKSFLLLPFRIRKCLWTTDLVCVKTSNSSFLRLFNYNHLLPGLASYLPNSCPPPPMLYLINALRFLVLVW